MARDEFSGPVLGLGVNITGGQVGALLLRVLDLSPVPVLVLLPLAAEDELEDPHDEDPGDAHDEGEDGGEEETPPLPLLQALLG